MKKIIGLFICLLFVPVHAHADPVAEIVEKDTPYGHISYPQISGLADRAVEQSVNQAILDEARTWECEPAGADDGEHTYDAITTLRLLDPNFLSFTTAKDFNCGGAHPNAYMDSYNFDLKRGARAPLSHLLVPEIQGANLTKFLVTGHVFTGGCMDENGQNVIAEIYANDMLDDVWCYYRTKDRVIFFPMLPHAVEACFEEFPVSLEAIKPYLQP